LKISEEFCQVESMSDPSKAVFVRNIGFRTEAKALTSVFTPFGPIANVQILKAAINDYKAHLGFGFIFFTTVGARKNAANYKGDITLDGHRFIVRRSRRAGSPGPPALFLGGIPEGTTEQ
jgi:RNA recognition motif-containing protein